MNKKAETIGVIASNPSMPDRVIVGSLEDLEDTPIKGARVYLLKNGSKYPYHTYLTNDLKVIEQDIDDTNLSDWISRGKTLGFTKIGEPCEVVKESIFHMNHLYWYTYDFGLDRGTSRFIDIFSKLRPDADIEVARSQDGVLIREYETELEYNGKKFWCDGFEFDPEHQTKFFAFLYAHLLAWGNLDHIVRDLAECLALEIDPYAWPKRDGLLLDKFHRIIGVVKQCLEVKQRQDRGLFNPSDLARLFPLYPVSLETWSRIHANQAPTKTPKRGPR